MKEKDEPMSLVDFTHNVNKTAEAALALVPTDMRENYVKMSALLLSAYDMSNETALAVMAAAGPQVALYRVNTDEQGATSMVHIIHTALKERPDGALLQ